MVNTRKFKAAIIEAGYSQYSFGNQMGWAKNTTCAKVNNKSPITIDEAKHASEILGICDPLKREEIFFA